MSEKICDRCKQPIRKGEGYAETDIGTGKWMHWPSCPPSAQVFTEKTVGLFTGPYFMEFEWKREDLVFACPRCRLPIEKGQKVVAFPQPDGSVWHAHCREEWEQEYMGSSSPNDKTGSHHSNPEKSVGEIQLVDGLTLKDYYDLRDLRLLLWGLEKELVGKYGVIEAEPLASKVRELIKKKVEQVTSKIGSSPPHQSHFSLKHNKVGTIKELATIEQISIVDEGTFLEDIQDIAKKFDPNKSIIENLRQQGFIAMRFSTTPRNYDPTHLDWYFVVDKANRLLTIVESKTSSPEHHSSPQEEQVIKAEIAKIYKELEKRQREIVFGPGTEKEAEEKRIRTLGYVMKALSDILEKHPSSLATKEEAEAEINVLIDNLASAIRTGGEVTPELRKALKENFLFLKSNPGIPPTYTDFERWLKDFQNMTVEQFKALPQERKDFIYSLFKTQYSNPSTTPSTGKHEETFLPKTEELE